MDRFLGFLKVFVVVAGLAIVLGTGALVWLLVTRAPTPPEAATPSGPTTPAQPTPARTFERELAVPPGTSVIDMRLADGQALLLLRAEDGTEYLAVVDAATGRRLGLLRLVPERP